MNKIWMLKQTIYNSMWALLALISILIISCSTGGEIKQEHLTSYMPRIITEDMECPVCGMYPARYPKWHSQVIFKDGSFVAFDGCKDMFKFLLEMDKYDKRHTRDDVAVVYVKDFNSGEWIDARDAYFVVGSSMMGPMGKELIPFGSHSSAMEFHERHGGMMVRYSEVTMQTIKSLGMHMHKGMHKMKGHDMK